MSSEPPHAEDSRPRRYEAAAWCGALVLLFLAVYGACNWITSLRSDSRVIHFDWERSIPIVPWLILPYMTIDAFFIAAPFLCRTRRELRVLGLRLASATIIAGACFLLIPLTLEGERPQFDGWAGWMHDFLKTNDRPHNMFPSLHVAYLLLLWPVYHRRLPLALRLPLHVWFVLVLASTLLVRQHHAIDLAGGALLAVLCAYIVPAAPVDARLTPDLRLAARYLLGSMACFTLASVIDALWALLLAWIGVSLLIMAAAYGFAGPAVYRKHHGRVPWAARLLLGPHMLGLYATRLYWFARAERPWHRLNDRIYFGRLLYRHEAKRLLREAPITAVLDLTAEHGETPALLRLEYLNVPILDLTLPTDEQLREACEFMAQRQPDGVVYVHCGLGYGRSGVAVAAAILGEASQCTVNEACDLVCRTRAGVTLRPAARESLARLQRSHART